MAMAKKATDPVASASMVFPIMDKPVGMFPANSMAACALTQEILCPYNKVFPD